LTSVAGQGQGARTSMNAATAVEIAMNMATATIQYFGFGLAPQ
jgi:hypothetical protein